MTPAGAEESWDPPPKKKVWGSSCWLSAEPLWFPLAAASRGAAGHLHCSARLGRGVLGCRDPQVQWETPQGCVPTLLEAPCRAEPWVGSQPWLLPPALPSPWGNAPWGGVGGQRPPSCEAAWVTSAALFALGHRTTALLSSWCRWPQRAGCPGGVLGMWGCLWQQDSLVLRACTRAFGA